VTEMEGENLKKGGGVITLYWNDK